MIIPKFSLFEESYETISPDTGDPDWKEYHSDSGRTKRIARIDYTYDTGVLTLKVVKFYESDGTTVAKTRTWTYTVDAGTVKVDPS